MVMALVVATGCMEPPMRAYFLVNSTREVVSVATRYNNRPQFRELYDLKPGESEVLAQYRTYEVKNFAIDQGLELRLAWSACQSVLPNNVLRRRTREDGKGRWILELTAEMLVCRHE